MRIASNKRRNLLTVCIGLICIALFLLIYGSIGYKSKDQMLRVGVVVDAGSSGTRLIVYSYNNKTFKQLNFIQCEEWGLNKYTEQGPGLHNLKKVIKQCFKEGETALPNNKKVPIYFVATAGMRLLKLRDPTIYDQMWKIILQQIKESEFKLGKAATVSGHEEARWAWVAANYLKGTLRSNSTVGIIEVGSGSTQIAFESKIKSNISNVQSIGVNGTRKMIFTQSYLCYGAKEVERRLLAKIVKDSNYHYYIHNPCFFKGHEKMVLGRYLWQPPCSGKYATNRLGEDITGPFDKAFLINGSGNFTKCYTLLNNMLNFKCTHRSCGLRNEFLPQVYGKFLALGSLYYTAKTLKLKSNSTKEIYWNASKELCKHNWNERSRFAPGEKNKDVYASCLLSVYGYYLLDTGFHFDKDVWEIDFRKRINGKDTRWALGLLCEQKNNMYLFLNIIKRPGFIALVIAGVICLVFSLLICIKALRIQTEVWERDTVVV